MPRAEHCGGGERMHFAAPYGERVHYRFALMLVWSYPDQNTLLVRFVGVVAVLFFFFYFPFQLTAPTTILLQRIQAE